MTREEVALRFLLNTLEQTTGAYGYDLWLPNNINEGDILWNCAVEVLKAEPPPPYTPPNPGMMPQTMFGAPTRESKTAEEIYPLAADILWLFSLKGIVRPGVRNIGGQAVTSGKGYSLTIRGRDWVKTYSETDVQELLVAL